jgi:hypothetical protein
LADSRRRRSPLPESRLSVTVSEGTTFRRGGDHSEMTAFRSDGPQADWDWAVSGRPGRFGGFTLRDAEAPTPPAGAPDHHPGGPGA